MPKSTLLSLCCCSVPRSDKKGQAPIKKPVSNGKAAVVSGNGKPVTPPTAKAQTPTLSASVKPNTDPVLSSQSDADKPVPDEVKQTFSLETSPPEDKVIQGKREIAKWQKDWTIEENRQVKAASAVQSSESIPKETVRSITTEPTTEAESSLEFEEIPWEDGKEQGAVLLAPNEEAIAGIQKQITEAMQSDTHVLTLEDQPSATMLMETEPVIETVSQTSFSFSTYTAPPPTQPPTKTDPIDLPVIENMDTELVQTTSGPFTVHEQGSACEDSSKEAPVPCDQHDDSPDGKNENDSHPVHQTQVADEAMIVQEHTEQVESAEQNVDSGSASSGTVEYSRTQMTETEEVIETEVEETVTMVIVGVVTNPGEEEEEIISLQDAVQRRRLDLGQGVYWHPTQRQFISMVEAMNNGWIKMGTQSVAKSQEKIKSMGIITIRTTRETLPYTVKNAMNTLTGVSLGLEQAARDGILDGRTGTYKDLKSGARMLIGDAVDKKLVEIEYDTDATGTVHEEVMQTYTVHAVVDQQLAKAIAFHEAVSKGLIDADSGEYVNNVTREKIPADIAISKGFIKATLTDNPDAISIDDIGSEVTKRATDAIKKKLLNPLRALRGFKK